MKRVISFILCLVMLALCTAGCASRKADTNTDTATDTATNVESDYASSDPIYVEMAVKDHGTMKIELYPDVAPVTVANFVKLVNDKFYDGLKFHRIVKGFMIQGGQGAETTSIYGEFAANGFDNKLSHDRGVISMARTNDPNSASSQFFICDTGDYKQSLDGMYAAFGKVIDGFDALDSIASVDVVTNMFGEKSSPVHDVIIDYVKVVEK